MTTPVDRVIGIGPKTTEFLKKRRVTTVEALIKRGASLLEQAPGFSQGRAESVLKNAHGLLAKSSVQTTKKSTAKTEKKVKKEKKNKKKDKDKKSKAKKNKKDKKDKKDKKKNKKNKK